MTARMVVMAVLVLAACDKKPEQQSAPEPTAAGSAAPAPASKTESDKSARDESVGAAGGIAAGLDDIAKSKPPAGAVVPPGTNTAAAPPVTPPPPTVTEPQPPSGSNTTATPPAPVTADATTLEVGDRVMARWTNGSWYPGKIVAITTDGKYDINYDDGDKSRGLPASKVRKKIAAAAGTASKAGKASASDSPCPGPGITRRCNGVCVNIQENNNHCGSCNNKCPAGKACDGHMSCRDAEGNL